MLTALTKYIILYQIRKDEKEITIQGNIMEIEGNGINSVQDLNLKIIKVRIIFNHI